MVDHDLPRPRPGPARAVGQSARRLAARRAQSPAALMGAAALLRVEHLRVEFPTRRATLVAVDDVSFAIGAGEVLGVVGESGAGKSVTGAAIIGLIDPPGRIAAGRIVFAGERIDHLPPEQLRRIRGKRIGTIFQDPLTSLNPLYSIGRQLVETIATHGEMSPRQARARAIELLAEVGIPAPAERFDHYPHHFSGGMRQRVVIALALAGNPQLIIADEPTTALDVSIQAQIIALLKKLCRDHGTAVMLITHDIGVIAEAADRVAVMYAGRIAEIGKLRDVVKLPRRATRADRRRPVRGGVLALRAGGGGPPWLSRQRRPTAPAAPRRRCSACAASRAILTRRRRC